MLILSNVAQLYDGQSAAPSSVHRGVDVHIDGGRIAQVRPHDPALRNASGLGGAHALVDCSGLTATPGLIDCHGHITILGLAKPAMDTMLGQGALLYVEKILHTTLVDGGVTT